VDLSKRRHVLVVGAGHDPYHALFHAAQEYICLDIEHVPGVTDVVADVLDMPFENERFDCVVATECVEHVVDPFQFVAHIDRVLVPGGLALLTVPFLFHQHGHPYDYWRPTRDCLAELFRGYQYVEIKSLGNRLHVISDLVTTAFAPRPVLAPLRVLNHLLVWWPGSISNDPHATTAPTGFLVAAVK
jgi:SAM-dependent methyltransferase